jgi:hypothetical protein
LHQIFDILFFPCPVGDQQSVEPTLTKRVPLRFSKRKLLVNFLDEALSSTHLFIRFNHPADTAGWGFYTRKSGGQPAFLFLYPERLTPLYPFGHPRDDRPK